MATFVRASVSLTQSVCKSVWFPGQWRRQRQLRDWSRHVWARGWVEQAQDKVWICLKHLETDTLVTLGCSTLELGRPRMQENALFHYSRYVTGPCGQTGHCLLDLHFFLLILMWRAQNSHVANHFSVNLCPSRSTFPTLSCCSMSLVAQFLLFKSGVSHSPHEARHLARHQCIGQRSNLFCSGLRFSDLVSQCVTVESVEFPEPSRSGPINGLFERMFETEAGPLFLNGVCLSDLACQPF